MRKWVTAAVVGILAAVLVGGVLYAPPRRRPGQGVGPGRIPRDGDVTEEKLEYAKGVVKTVKWDDEKKSGSIVLSAGKKKRGREATATLFVNVNTQVFVGDEEKTMKDLAEGSKVIVGYPKPKEGVTPVALLIRVQKEAKTDKDKDAADDPADSTDKGDAAEGTAED